MDRVLHHAVFKALYHIFDKTFIFDSYSSRDEKGTHRAVNRLQEFFFKVSKNNTRTCFVLKCDIKKFFDSVDQEILITLIKKRVYDTSFMWLLEEIIKSFSRGIPLGNVTSQIFANIYLNELDQFIKHTLKIRYYIRYCDDFVILSDKRIFLEEIVLQINEFLKINLKLLLHPNKIIIKKYHQGIDFLGYVSFPYHRILRTKTKNRMFKKIEIKIGEESFDQSLQSYFGILKHCNSYKLGKKVIDFILNNRKVIHTIISLTRNF